MSAIKTARSPLTTFLRYALLVFVAIIFIFPILFMVMSSLKPDLQLLRDTSSIAAFSATIRSRAIAASPWCSNPMRSTRI